MKLETKAKIKKEIKIVIKKLIGITLLLSFFVGLFYFIIDENPYSKIYEGKYVYTVDKNISNNLVGENTNKIKYVYSVDKTKANELKSLLDNEFSDYK
jgi:hypothetical protein